MGFFSSIVNSITHNPIVSAATGIVGSLFNGGNDNKNNNDDMRNMINDQIKSYKQQTELTNQELNRTRSEQDATKRAIQVKQIRALRNNYRAAGAGLLGVGQPASGDTSIKLGG